MASFSNNSIVRHNSEDADKVRVRISNTTNAFVEHTIQRSLITTSAVLISQLHHPSIHIHWNGTLDVFAMYRAWLYSRDVLTKSELVGKDPSVGTTKFEYINLIACWGMGQTLQDAVYQELVISSVIQRLQTWTGTDTPPFIYALTAPVVDGVWRETVAGAPIRRLIIDTTARLGHAADFQHFREDSGYPIAFIKDLMVALGRGNDLQITRGSSLKRNQPAHPKFPLPPPPPPATATSRPPAPFFHFKPDLDVQQNSPSILRRSSVSSPGATAKHVHFEGEGESSAEDERCSAVSRITESNP
ncbi:uncharacterized protein K460DRAFT_394319 [Cucurbitaria berberidis CBS 394.84]|uniref:Uncharacterized protein n=1 Tax=Cucurbitaria berberidis CBS 394.84 TaxID=1168544 RepID=A0A9P4LBE6_9PLEO|nr:uncharacterized protein K460DRAFT_394319 [Cucurbitaria berberidis CBS 394.84]KAF1849501.1 hypothetical protein K460DRAFT_394319 [Cucurbitaria berberidis CBS 394.84]